MNLGSSYHVYHTCLYPHFLPEILGEGYGARHDCTTWCCHAGFPRCRRRRHLRAGTTQKARHPSPAAPTSHSSSLVPATPTLWPSASSSLRGSSIQASCLQVSTQLPFRCLIGCGQKQPVGEILPMSTQYLYSRDTLFENTGQPVHHRTLLLCLVKPQKPCGAH